METARDKLIVALDVETASRARELFTALRGVVGMFKIGMQLFTAVGPSIVHEIINAGGRVFLDLKYHDIPNTVAAAGVEAARHGISIFNVHTFGGTEMMRRTADAVAEVSKREQLVRPRIIGVTLLTSVNQKVLTEVGVASSPDQHVPALAQLAAASGLDGVVASPLEVVSVRAAVAKRDFLVVTPGVRPSGAAPHDQRRLTTPAEAIRAGSDYLVIGRPIIDADDPVAAANSIVAEIAGSFTS
ncbi:MAG TPA: orotidine-5'-phosphate decarboxylase [Pyrinomonadaceae bacterium]|nr:orotidine-5'-phosphate decarboxylase [Pyrinomonadaceae bacterium]